MILSPHLIAHLPYLAEVAELKSFTRAAESMHLTQAAVSYQIKQLEEKLCCQLVIRQSGSQLKLTSAGEYLVYEYQHCAKRLAAALEHINPDQYTGELRITTPVDFGSLVMPKILLYLQQKVPNLKIHLNASDDVFNLHSSRWEMAIRVNSQEDVINPTPIYTTHTCVVASPNYLNERGIPSSLRSLSSHTILVRENSKFRSWSRLLKGSKIPFSVLKNQHVLGNSFAIREAALEGLGLAILPEFVLRNEIQSGTLVPVLAQKTRKMIPEFYISRLDAPQYEKYELLLREAFKSVYKN